MPQGYEDHVIRIAFGLGQLVILAMIMERGLYFIFDYKLWRDALSKFALKGPISFAVALFICWYYDYDILARVLDPTAITDVGIVITAAILAGGSVGAITLFQDILKFSREGREQIQAVQAAKQEAAIQQAKVQASK